MYFYIKCYLKTNIPLMSWSDTTKKIDDVALYEVRNIIQLL